MNDYERREAWRQEPERRRELLEQKAALLAQMYDFAAPAAVIHEQRQNFAMARAARQGMRDYLAQIDDCKAMLTPLH